MYCLVVLLQFSKISIAGWVSVITDESMLKEMKWTCFYLHSSEGGFWQSLFSETVRRELESRSAFMTLLNIYDGGFLCENINGEKLLTKSQ